MRGYPPQIALAELLEVDDKGKQQRVTHHAFAGEKHSEVYRPQPFGFSSSPPKGSTGAVVSLGGERNRSLFFGGEHDDHRPTGLEEGQAKLYDAAGNLIFFGRKNGLSVSTKKGNTEIKTADGDTVIEGTEGKITIKSKKAVHIHSDDKIHLGSKDGQGTARVATESGYSNKVFAKV